VEAKQKGPGVQESSPTGGRKYGPPRKKKEAVAHVGSRKESDSVIEGATNVPQLKIGGSVKRGGGQITRVNTIREKSQSEKT